MSDVTQILASIERGEPQAAERLLPLIYDELRRLATVHLAAEKPGHTLQPTALVHEAYLRLVDVDQQQRWEGRRHFFAAAAESMRRILVEAARRKGRLRHGGDRIRLELDDLELAAPIRSEQLTALDEALSRLESIHAEAAELVKMRFFAGLNNAEAASLLGISPRKSNQVWAYARAWLLEEIGDD
jgi:RNA polymerase sigma factor (TIGR02999 family)